MSGRFKVLTGHVVRVDGGTFAEESTVDSVVELNQRKRLDVVVLQVLAEIFDATRQIALHWLLYLCSHLKLRTKNTTFTIL